MNVELIVLAVSAGLVGWRFAFMLVLEEGPGGIIRRVRTPIREIRIEPGVSRSRPFFGPLFGCVWCLSIWTTALALLLGWWHLEVVIVLTAFAVSGLAHGVIRD